MKQLTLAAFYGSKPPILSELIESMNAEVENTALAGFFTPYPIRQIHATLTGLEKITGASENYNANYWNRAGERRVMDFSCLLETLSESLPMQARIGGFSESYDGFRSLGEIPYRRAFSVDWNSGKLNLIGWPFAGPFDDFDFSRQRLLWALRSRWASRCHIRHKYHEQQDNDLYMVLGSLNLPAGLDQAALDALQKEGRKLEWIIRDFLHHNPANLSLSPDTLFLVQYEEEALPPLSSTAWPVSELLDKGFPPGL